MSHQDSREKDIHIENEVINYEKLLKEQGFSVSTTVGLSMYPMLRNRRDTIIIRPVDRPLRKYDIPLYKRDGKYILHRIIRVKENEYIIRGDNCIEKEHVTENMIIGVLSEFYRGEKKINMKGIGYQCYVRIWCFTFPVRFFYKKMRCLAGKILRVAK